MPAVPTFEPRKVVSLFVVMAYIGLTLLGLWALWELRSILPPLLVAAIIAMTLTPEVDRIERRGFFRFKIRRGVAIGLIYFLFLAIITLIVRLIPLVSGQMTALITGHLPQQLLHGNARDVQGLATRWMNTLHIPMVMRPPVLDQARHVPELVSKGLQWLSDNLPALAGNLIWVVLVPIITFFLLLDFNKILGKVLLFVRADRREDLLTIVTDVISVFGSWVRGVLLVMGLDILVIYVVLRLAGLGDYALTLAVTAGVLYTIPYFGALVSTVLMGLVAWVTHGLGAALGLTAVMVIIHQVIFDNIVAPRIIGGSVHLHPLLTLLALIAGGTLFGIGGTLLAVPIAAAVQVVLVYLFPQLVTDVVAVRRAAGVVQATIAKGTEATEPEARKAGNQAALNEDAALAHLTAESPLPNSAPVLPPG